jgi:hypothetical protein
LELERVRASQSKKLDCPAKPLMARKRDSSQFMRMTIERLPSFVNRYTVENDLVWSVWFV